MACLGWIWTPLPVAADDGNAPAKAGSAVAGVMGETRGMSCAVAFISWYDRLRYKGRPFKRQGLRAQPPYRGLRTPEPTFAPNLLGARSRNQRPGYILFRTTPGVMGTTPRPGG